MSEKRKCTAITAAGERCQALVLKGQDHCYNHAPELAKARSMNGSKGGKARSRTEPDELERVEVIRKQLRSVTSKILSGEIDPETGRVAVASLNTELRGAKVKDEIWKTTRMRERLDRLEQLAAQKEQTQKEQNRLPRRGA